MPATAESQPAPDAPWADRLVSIRDICDLFQLHRTAAYELTHRPGFPEPVVISPRCYRWWASEVTAYAAALRRDNPRPRCRTSSTRPRPHGATRSGSPACRITGTVRMARTRRAAS
jgi:predicted DNA-binding transcriptional regulator AlpA